MQKLEIMSDFLLKPITSMEFGLHFALYKKHNHKLSIKLNKKNVIKLFNLRNVNLEDLKIIKALNEEFLKLLSLSKCSFLSNNLKFLKHFTNLETLYLFNCSSVYSSLIYLKEMRKVEFLLIGSSRLDSGFEYLSDSVQIFHCNI
ncbi:18576_t:CDS:2 [Gigaspora margarita]|uniref:18576_t:CDS:1 n=1 Tax=Gigaspora margarita TaxID=4874 RepID=A0ABN7V2U3_GIGMA|nr:18576_t:CDS:2 [Gigaspora margarita]